MNLRPNENTRFKKGMSPWNKGKPCSEATRKKIGDRNRGKKMSEEAKRKIGLNGFHYGMLGKKHPKEWSQKRSEQSRGEKAGGWKGGLTKLSSRIRNSFEYRLWRSDCFRRDDFTCQDCRIRGGSLAVDHIKPFSVIIAENRVTSLEEALNCGELWDINNGRTLCTPCHKKTDTFLSGANKYKLQDLQLNAPVAV